MTTVDGHQRTAEDDVALGETAMSKVRSHLWSTTRIPEPPLISTAPQRPTPTPITPTAFRSVEAAPPMARRNGIGTILLGRMNDPAIIPARVKLLWLTILFVPVLPLRAYAVTGGMDGYYFHGQMGLWVFLRRYRWRIVPYFFTVIVEALLRAVLVLGIALLACLFVAWLFGRL